MVKRESWTEADLDSLPAEEPDLFERKAGKLFDDQGNFRDATAKALSAFANSGGGSLIIGVEDDGTPDGVVPFVGRTAIRDWVEQKVPHLLDYPLSDFRVHTVIKSDPSRIPDGREVVVIDVGDSATAPHQSKRDKIYYRREGGRYERAPHFYLELLRQRLTNPTLEFSLKKIEPIDVWEHDDGLFLEAGLKFEIENVGRVAAYEWQLSVREFQRPIDLENEEARVADYYFGNFPKKNGQSLRTVSMPLTRTILPGCKFTDTRAVGCQLRPKARTDAAVREEIEGMLATISLNCQLATETSPGELVAVPLKPVLDADALANAARAKCAAFFHI
jgi:Putative DNA-binding domain